MRKIKKYLKKDISQEERQEIIDKIKLKWYKNRRSKNSTIFKNFIIKLFRKNFK